MKVVKALAAAALFAVMFSAGSDAEDSKTGAPAQPEAVPAKEFKAKAGYCETCHGLSARGFVGTNPMPRLAGQQPGYIKNQLQAFIERRRLNPVRGRSIAQSGRWRAEQQARAIPGGRLGACHAHGWALVEEPMRRHDTPALVSGGCQAA